MTHLIRISILAALLTWLPSCAHDARVMSSAEAATVVVKQTTVPRQSNGRIDRAYPDGNDGAPLQWGTCPNQQWTVGQSCAVNLRTACSLAGTNAGTATLAKVSGTLPAGCSAGTNGITGTVSGAQASNQVVWQATDGVTSVTAPFSVEAVAAPAGDTTAPTIPTGCSGAGGANSVTITCDQSSDPYVGEAGSGVASYKIYRNGVLVGTKVAPAANIQSALAGVTIGSADGTQSCTQTGANRAMSGGGAGLGSTADQAYGCGYQVVGDVLATAKLTGFAGSVTTGTAGWMLRAGTAAGAIYGACRGRDTDDKANLRFRSATDGTANNDTLSGALSYPMYFRLLYTAAGLVCSTSTDGNVYTATNTARTLSLGTSPYLLAFHASGTAATNTTSTLEQLNITSPTVWTHVDSTTTGGSYQVSAVDANGNESAKGAAFSATPTSVTACSGGSFTPLHYDDFESATIDSSKTPTAAQRWKIQDDYDTTLDTTITSSALRAGSGSSRSARTQLTYTKNGGANYSRNGGGSTSESGHRNELIAKAWLTTGFNQNMAIGSEYWAGFEVYLPAAGDSNGDPEWLARPFPHYEILFQLHDSPDNAGRCGTAEPSRNPMLVLSVDSPKSTPPTVAKTRWTISSRATDVACQTSLTYQYNRTWQLGEFTNDLGRWVRWTFRYKPSFGADGILQIWKDGVEVTGTATTGSGSLPLFGPNTYNDTLGPYMLPIGIYAQPYDPVAADGTTLTTTPSSGSCGGFSPCLPARRVFYLDNWMFGRVDGNPTTSVGVDNVGYRSVTPGATTCP